MPRSRHDQTLCWYCHAAAGPGHGCRSCGRIQPLPEGSTHFDLFGLARRLQFDLDALEQQFYALSRELHPDRHQTGSPYERELSVEWSSALNVAYETLRDPVTRAEYLLGLEGVRLEQGRKAPPALFEELLAMQEDLETLREAKTDADAAAGRSRVLETQKQLEVKMIAGRQKLEALFVAWDEGAGERPAVLEAIREQLGELAYLRTTLRDVGQALATRTQ